MTDFSWRPIRYARVGSLRIGLAALLCASLAACADNTSPQATNSGMDQPVNAAPTTSVSSYPLAGGNQAASPYDTAPPYNSNYGSAQPQPIQPRSGQAYNSPPPYNNNYQSGAAAGAPSGTSTTKTSSTYSENEIVSEGEQFFGSASKGMADAVRSIFARYGEPNAFIRGEEGTGAVVVGLRYGQGELVMKNGAKIPVYWQGPSVGWDFGGNAVKSFTLIYNLPDSQAIFQRFPGVEGSAYLIGGLSINYQQRGNIVLAPMRSGVGLRLGASVGYLNYTPQRDWLPF